MRTDFVIHANQKRKTSYYIVVRPAPLDECENITSSQTAYLIYDNAAPPPNRPVNITSVTQGPVRISRQK